ncbi:MAG: protein arginine kinase [Acutalibacteraceae bacterium]|nr:protein arginine kinase [Acutalibacteraceae bacterium]
MDKWYLKNGKDADTVFSVRIRLARNLSGFPFPNKMSDEQKYSVIQKVSDAVFKSEVGKDYKFIDMDKISETEAIFLAERHLISPEFIKNTKGRALILKNDESVSVMINEEDHIRIQSIAAGLEFETACKNAFEIEKIIGNAVEYAFDKKFGYLTECPTNLGTGMRASAMLHLPALEKIGALERIFNSISKFGVAIRGTFGEGTKAKNSMYQISNQVTLGISEKESIENVENIINQLISKEKEAREAFDRFRVEDTVFRALGTLKYARMISSEEFYKLISDIRLGVSMGILNIPISVINSLNLLNGSAGVSSLAGGNLDADTRDTKRAQNLRESLKNYM